MLYPAAYERLLPLCGTQYVVKKGHPCIRADGLHVWTSTMDKDMTFTFNDRDRLEFHMRHMDPRELRGQRWHQAAHVYWGHGWHTELVLSEDLATFTVLESTVT